MLTASRHFVKAALGGALQYDPRLLIFELLGNVLLRRSQVKLMEKFVMDSFVSRNRRSCRAAALRARGRRYLRAGAVIGKVGRRRSCPRTGFRRHRGSGRASTAPAPRCELPGGVWHERGVHRHGAPPARGQVAHGRDGRGTVLLQNGAKFRTAVMGEAGDEGELEERSMEDEPLHRRAGACLCATPGSSSRHAAGSNGAAPSSSPKSISSALLRDQLSADEVAMSEMWIALGYPSRQSDVDCNTLCASAVEYVSEVGGHLPPSTDVACYSVDGVTHCDADADPFYSYAYGRCRGSRAVARRRSADAPRECRCHRYQWPSGTAVCSARHLHSDR